MPTRFLAIAAAALALAGCTTAADSSASAAPVVAVSPLVEDTPRIGVATAFSPELAALLPRLEGTETHVINGRPFYTGMLSGKPVVLFETGVSIVNAAMNTQLLLDHFEIEAIVVSGIAGGVDPELSIGDVTVPAKWGQYNEMIYMRELPGGGYASYNDGYASDEAETFEFAAFEFMQPDGVRIVSAEDPEPARRFWFEADEDMMAIAEQIADDITFVRCTADDQCLSHEPKMVLGGNGVTGSVFQDNARFREYLYDTFDAHVLEMETSAIAMVAYANSTPYLAFRSLSDLAGGGDTGMNEMHIFEDIAAENAALVVLEFLRQYPGATTP